MTDNQLTRLALTYLSEVRAIKGALSIHTLSGDHHDGPQTRAAHWQEFHDALAERKESLTITLPSMPPRTVTFSADRTTSGIRYSFQKE